MQIKSLWKNPGKEPEKKSGKELAIRRRDVL